MQWKWDCKQTSHHTCEDSYVIVLVSVWTIGISLVEISVLCAASEMVTISVFTTGGCDARNKQSVQKTEEVL